MKRFFIIIGITITTTNLYSFISYSNQGCFDLWYSRNTLFSSNGYCFTSKLSKKFFSNKGCSDKFKQLQDKWAKEELKEIQKWESKKGCTKKDLDLSIKKSYFTNRSDDTFFINIIKEQKPFYLRTSPSTKGKILDKIWINISNVHLLGYSKDKKWALVSYENYGPIHKGWIKKRYLKKNTNIKSGEPLLYSEKKELIKKLIKKANTENNSYSIDYPISKNGYIITGIKNYSKNKFSNYLYSIKNFSCKSIKESQFSCELFLEEEYIYKTEEGSESALQINFKAIKKDGKLFIEKIEEVMGFG